ncbi:LuxR C-terminal-related transcriptional regulator [Kitasatospora sp. NPDC002227]|uniref:helix-turn-helix transcriptional regulator n=1 Tax=Kitasatospora sp. NPDC002227 TaxID=3154773 RepID=UPI003316AFD3
MYHTVDGNRINPTAGIASEEAISRAQEIIGEALNSYRRQSSQLVATIDPVTTPTVLREAIEQRPGTPLTLQVVGGPVSELTDQETAEFPDFVRREILGRGHTLQVLQHRTAALDWRHRQQLGRLAAEGVQVRVAPGHLPSMVALDAELAILQITGPGGRPQVLLARGEAAGALHQFHRALWDQALELTRIHRTPAAVVLDETQSKVLHKLCAGMKDETAARQLNVSVRTYRRHVATILNSLSVGSRFEAGLKVAELGLVNFRLAHDLEAPAAG